MGLATRDLDAALDRLATVDQLPIGSDPWPAIAELTEALRRVVFAVYGTPQS